MTSSQVGILTRQVHVEDMYLSATHSGQTKTPRANDELTSEYRTASGNELRIKSSLKIGMTEEGVMSSTVLQLCWGGIIIPSKDLPRLTRMHPIKVLQW